ncbi:MAG: ATP-binding cassette domain-containing protein, partial [Afipia sp.]|nr:ATP-binding cassette domain-containing protein [Afipia sp.]
KSDIEGTLDRFPSLRNRRAQFAGSLSGGEQQMLAIGRALMSRPELLLMDEPSLGLAPKIVAEIFRIVTQLKQEGLTIFLVEQNVSAALTVADYFYVMERGSVIFAGTPDELKQNDVIANTYLGLH